MPGRLRQFILPSTTKVVLPAPQPPVEPPKAIEAENDALHSDQAPHEADAPRTTSTRFRTVTDAFGVFREYLRQPQRIPDENQTLAPAIKPRTKKVAPIVVSPEIPLDEAKVAAAIAPCTNMSTFKLFSWFRESGPNLSRKVFKGLLGTLVSPGFDLDHLRGVNADRLEDALDKADRDDGQRFREQVGGESASEAWDGWNEACVRIHVPTGNKVSGASTSEPFDVQGLHYRSIIQVIRNVFSSPEAERFHFEPFRTYWEPPISESTPSTPTDSSPAIDPALPRPGPTTRSSRLNPPAHDIQDHPTLDHRHFVTRLRGDLYESDAWLAEDEAIQALPHQDGDNLPRAIAALMVWSDGTHLTSFGRASQWPFYNGFGNDPKLPDDIHDFIHKITDKAASTEMLRYCKLELFHGVWKVLLDEEFMQAYREGLVVECGDGIKRRLYPRFFTYSADYPEKVLIATIKNLGSCPCPLCLVRLDDVYKLGMKSDRNTRENHPRIDDENRRRRVHMARQMILTQGYVPGNNYTNDLLKDESLVPIINTFSELFGAEFGVNFFEMLANDLLHEFELGVWKAVFIHLVRILQSLGPSKMQQFNERFRHIGNFGKSTIRSFASMNVTDMKNWAAYTFEDCLQCCLPCIEGLLPEPENTAVMRLISILALWHGLAKLRQHSEITLQELEAVTERLGQELRDFQKKTCARFETTELPKEYAARQRRAKATAKTTSSMPKQTKAKATVIKGGCRAKHFSLRTVKLHLLGHYPPVIRRFGTTDSYSTQNGELEHRTVKALYKMTNKKNYVRDSARIQRRQELLRWATEKVRRLGVVMPTKVQTIDYTEATPLPPVQTDVHYQIAVSSKHWIHIGTLVCENPNEPEYATFIPDLKDHILLRLKVSPTGLDGSFSDKDRDPLIIKNNLLYQHAYIRINYTTYNVTRDYDIIAPRVPSRSCVMMPSTDAADGLYAYARVLGVFHAEVIYPPSGLRTPERIQLLWVRWMTEESLPSADYVVSMQRIRYAPFDADSGLPSFGFVDPSTVIRGCHVIPAFNYRYTQDLLPASSVRDHGTNGDWAQYYVNQFVDRDMLMRFLGWGVGHLSTWDLDWAKTMLRRVLALSPLVKVTDDLVDRILRGETLDIVASTSQDRPIAGEAPNLGTGDNEGDGGDSENEEEDEEDEGLGLVDGDEALDIDKLMAEGDDPDADDL